MLNYKKGHNIQILPKIDFPFSFFFYFLHHKVVFLMKKFIQNISMEINT